MITQMVTLRHNGQITIPARLRKAMDIKDGDRLVVELTAGGALSVRTLPQERLHQAARTWKEQVEQK